MTTKIIERSSIILTSIYFVINMYICQQVFFKPNIQKGLHKFHEDLHSVDITFTLYHLKFGICL